MTTRLRLTYASLIAAAILTASPAIAETMTFTAELKASSEVPPNPSTAAGSVTATFDTATKVLSWKGTIAGLTGTATMAHFHGPAEPGKNAGVMVPSPGVTAGAFEGQATLNDAQVTALMAGQMYFNIHTAQNPGGEVRGQVVKAP